MFKIGMGKQREKRDIRAEMIPDGIREGEATAEIPAICADLDPGAVPFLLK
jgi:hypothetical protein